MRFGINIRNRLTGADLYVRIFQLTGLAPVLYVLVACVHPAVFTSGNVFSVLFGLGTSALPRWEALALSRLYRMSHSEVLVCAAVLVFALAFGLAADTIQDAAFRFGRRPCIHEFLHHAYPCDEDHQVHEHE